MIDWAAFAIVAAAALVSASVVVSLFAYGLRLLNVGRGLDADDSPGVIETTPSGSVTVVSGQPEGRPRWATIAAVACFALCSCAVLFGIYLIVPFFHAS
ncbi:hypothetical protein [Agreia bicolorata]|uniref:Uncharacterized protein n=1 Tax=Agreia bicolorata TaxID=110935 RepID=A0ABR5CIS6_9MICO|nr:hypothetical protein [Agreia bicolorata]KJC65474.1 hypothetical protein TZ00_00990 [Agreia bicolorata]